MRIVPFLAFGALALSAASCQRPDNNPGAEETISRDAFVQAYSKLRVAALRTVELEIPIHARDSILQEMGLTEEDIITFAEVRGADGEFMRDIWAEVDSLIRNVRMEEDPFGGDDDSEVEGNQGSGGGP